MAERIAAAPPFIMQRMWSCTSPLSYRSGNPCLDRAGAPYGRWKTASDAAMLKEAKELARAIRRYAKALDKLTAAPARTAQDARDELDRARHYLGSRPGPRWPLD